MLLPKQQERLDKFRANSLNLTGEKRIPTAKLPVYVARRDSGDDYEAEKKLYILYTEKKWTK